MRNNFFLISYFIALLIFTSFCEEDDKKKWKRAEKKNETNEKKPFVPKELNLLTKSNTCMQLINKLLVKEMDAYDKLLTRAMELNEDFGEEDAKNYVISFILVNCVNLMDNTEFMLLRSMAKANMEIDFKEFDNSLKFEEVKEMLFKNDTKLLGEYKTKLDKFEKDYKYALQEYQDRDDGQSLFRKKGDIGVFGNKFKDIPKTKRNLIGFGLLILVVAVMGFMTFKLIKKDKKEKKKKDKKKK